MKQPLFNNNIFITADLSKLQYLFWVIVTESSLFSPQSYWLWPQQLLDPTTYTVKREPIKFQQPKMRTRKTNAMETYWLLRNTCLNNYQNHIILRPKYNHLFTKFCTHIILIQVEIHRVSMKTKLDKYASSELIQGIELSHWTKFTLLTLTEIKKWINAKKYWPT